MASNTIPFVQDCLDGKAASFLKSDEIPEGWDKQPVKELVGKNFEATVFDTQKSTFVFFYASWCEACQNMMKEVDKLGQLYENRNDVVIARMDSVHNEVPGLLILNVPTVVLFVRGNRKPIYYTDGQRSTDDFSKFIVTTLGNEQSQTAADHQKHEKLNGHAEDEEVIEDRSKTKFEGKKDEL